MNKEFKIYTKTGDDGTTGLVGGTRVKKSNIRLEAYGTVDELNSWIGLIRTSTTDFITDQNLTSIQERLFVIGSHLATDSSGTSINKIPSCSGTEINKLEAEIDRMQGEMPPINRFILPGGSISAAQCHVARTVCRRAERRIAELSENTTIDKNIQIYVNRLSDYLFVLSRYFNHLNQISEVFWDSEK
jgi:cob(I)alamin adenosyltransferase